MIYQNITQPIFQLQSPLINFVINISTTIFFMYKIKEIIIDRILNLSVSSSSIRVVHDQKYMVTGIVDKRQFSKTKNKVYG